MKQHALKTKLAVALLASTALLGTGVLAATAAAKAPAAAPAAQQPAQTGLTLRVSDHAATALDGVTAARLALMQWSGDRAKTILTQVKDTLGNAKDGLAKATLVKYGKGAKASDKLLTDTMYYPVGITSDTVESIAPATAPQKLASAGGSAHQAGAPSDAARPAAQAKPAETVDTSVFVALLPRDATVLAIDTAIAQIDKGDFAAADLALGSIGNSILYGSMSSQASQPISG